MRRRRRINRNETETDTLRDKIKKIIHSLFSKCHIFSLFTRNIIFLNAFENINTFLALIIFTKLSNSQNFLKIHFTLFHANWVLLWKGETDVYLTMAFNEPIFTKITSAE